MVQPLSDLPDPAITGVPALDPEKGTDRTCAVEADRTVSESGEKQRIEPSPLLIWERREQQEPSQTVGQCLRAIREKRGASVEAAAKALLLRSQILVSMERMESSAIPKGYLTKYVGAYANWLGLDREDVIAAYTGECGAIETVARPQKIVAPSQTPTPLWRRPAALTAAGAVFSAVIAAMLLAMPGSDLQGPAPDAPLTAQPFDGARTSLFAEAPLPDSLVKGQLPLTLTAGRAGWLEVRGADGTIFRSRIMGAGETYHPRVGAGWTVSARDGGAFEWRLGDVVIGSLGDEGAAVYAASVDDMAAEAVRMAAPSLAAAGSAEASR